MHRTEMVIYFVQAFFQQNVSGSVYTGCKRPLCCVFVWVKMFKVGCRRPVTDTGSGLFGLDRVGGERVLNLSLSGSHWRSWGLHSRKCSPWPRECLIKTISLPAGSYSLSLQQVLFVFWSPCSPWDVAAVLHDKLALFAFKSPSGFVFLHPPFSRLLFL